MLDLLSAVTLPALDEREASGVSGRFDLAPLLRPPHYAINVFLKKMIQTMLYSQNSADCMRLREAVSIDKPSDRSYTSTGQRSNRAKATYGSVYI